MAMAVMMNQKSLRRKRLISMIERKDFLQHAGVRRLAAVHAWPGFVTP
jgi:hypothetical protein